MSTPQPSISDRRQGNFLILATVIFTVVTSIVLASLQLVTERTRNVRSSRNLLVARNAARSAVERQIADIRRARDLASVDVPFYGLDALDSNPLTGAGGYSRARTDEPLLDFGGKTLAEYDVFVDVTAPDPSTREIAVGAYAYVPDKSAYSEGAPDAVRADAHATVQVVFRSAEVFDYSYFINHWGWFFGNSIVANGNVRSNGQFDFGGYASTVNGSPRYEGSSGTDLVGYLDDNGDGMTDGTDGGVYSGMGVVNASRVRGMGGDPQNQHLLDGMLPMPNLSDLSGYEARATEVGGTLRVGGVVQVDGVLGDDVGEKQNVYLEGTATDPVVLDGPVVVRGSVIISGYVTGQGVIYSGGNVYVPADLKYVDPPSTSRPGANDQASVEAWRAANATRDSLGLFAREHVVIGDYTHPWWQYYVNDWIHDPNNESSEDAGLDGIQNTAAGLDGIRGTADDDVLEGDGVWTVSRYTATDATLGRIPAGKSIGDVIPGSGEDIDGDGQFDGTTDMREFDLPAKLDHDHWAGNLPPGAKSFSDVSTVDIQRIDATLYTNHTLAALMLNWGGEIAMNGSIVSRNESIIYGANQISMNHDERLTGRGSGADAGFWGPLAWDPLKVENWRFDRALPPSVLADPSAIAAYFGGVK